MEEDQNQLSIEKTTFGALHITKQAKAIRRKDLSVLSTSEKTGVFATDGESTNISQKDLKRLLPEQAAKNIFELRQPSGPYIGRYDRIGSHMLLAGYRGHLAIIRMADKHLLSEVHLDNDTIMDARFLHNCTMYAVARSREITLFDDRGIEIHNINRPRPAFVDFLPHHWLLTSVCQGGQLHYLDISTGSLVAQLQTPFTGPSSLTHNPRDALVSVSSTTTGIVNLYSPNLVDKPVMSINCSNVGISRHCFSLTSPHMLVTNTDGLLKIFDMRNYGSEVAAYSLLNRTLTDLSISQSGVVCVTSPHSADFYKLSDLLAFDYDSIGQLSQKNGELLSMLERKATGDSHCSLAKLDLLYMSHKYDGSAFSSHDHSHAIQRKVVRGGRTGSAGGANGRRSGNSNSIVSCEFRPYYDDCVLGLTSGIQSIIIPGSGSVDYDFQAVNLFEGSKQRNNATVHKLLDKIPYTLIGNRDILTSVHRPTDEEWIKIKYGLINEALSNKIIRHKKKRSLRAKLNERDSIKRVAEEVEKRLNDMKSARTGQLHVKKTYADMPVLERFRIDGRKK